MSKSVLIFVTDHSYAALDPQQLSFDKGDQIQVLKQTELWWWGVHLKTKTSGWFGPTWGHIIASKSALTPSSTAFKDRGDHDKKSITGKSPLIPHKNN